MFFAVALFDDTTRYIRIPTRTVSGCLSLARALLVAAPKQGPAEVFVRLQDMHGAAIELQGRWIAASASADGDTPRTYDRRIDRAWAIFYERTHHWVEIEHADKAERAEQLVEKLFPTGLDFTNLAYPDEWAESDKRLTMIANDELREEFVELIGEEFVAHLEQAHVDYGDVLGITAKKDESGPVRMLESIRALRMTMADYATLLIGLTRRSDAAAVASTEASLEPILRFRTPRGKAEIAEQSPEDPLPEPPAAE